MCKYVVNFQMHCLTFANYKAIAHIAFITWHLMAVIPRARSFIGTTGQKGQACLEAIYMYMYMYAQGILRMVLAREITAHKNDKVQIHS